MPLAPVWQNNDFYLKLIFSSYLEIRDGSWRFAAETGSTVSAVRVPVVAPLVPSEFYLATVVQITVASHRRQRQLECLNCLCRRPRRCTCSYHRS